MLAGARDAERPAGSRTVSFARSAIGGPRSAPRSPAASTGDAVVIAGKGHELGQEIAGVVHPFSDRAEVLAALTEFGRAGRPTTVQTVTAPHDAPRIRP